MEENKTTEIVTETETKEENIIIASFEQFLGPEDLIRFNEYVLLKRTGPLRFILMGSLIVILGVVNFFSDGALNAVNIVINVVCILIGLFLAIFANTLIVKKQKSIIRKRIEEINATSKMGVTITDECVKFEALDVEITEEEKKDGTNIFSVPWGGINKVVNDGEYLFIEVAGYKALLIKLEDATPKEVVVDYIKGQLESSKRYEEKIKE